MQRFATKLIFTMITWTLILAACGKKGDPRAPELATPEVIKDLNAKPAQNGIALSWSRPFRYVDGREMKDLAAFVIFRKELPPTCPECPVPYRELTTVAVEDRERFVKQKQYRYVDEETRPKVTYRYRVASQLTDGSRSAPSNEVEITRGP